MFVSGQVCCFDDCAGVSVVFSLTSVSFGIFICYILMLCFFCVRFTFLVVFFDEIMSRNVVFLLLLGFLAGFRRVFAPFVVVSSLYFLFGYGKHHSLFVPFFDVCFFPFVICCCWYI